ncbi:carbohydrate-binding module family 48 protein, partial [Tortispora caseinolytica NRRL Y-17796]
IPVMIHWNQPGHKVYMTGTFTGWRRMIRLSAADNGFSAIVNLPPGIHRIRFVVDNELRCSDALPTATDSMGNLVNYIQQAKSDSATHNPPVRHKSLPPGMHRRSSNPHSPGASGEYDDDGYEIYEDTEEVAPKVYTTEIPDIFLDPDAADKYIAEDYPTPPGLPPHLETVILNTNSTEKDDSSVLPIPNHVILNHLATTSIKHNVLAVATVNRYARKYVTQVLYAPL